MQPKTDCTVKFLYTQQNLCKLEIDQQGEGIHNGGDKGGGHDSGVKAQLVRQHRQGTAHQLCADNEQFVTVQSVLVIVFNASSSILFTLDGI